MATDSMTGKSLNRRDSAGSADGSTYIAAAETTAPSPVNRLSVSIFIYAAIPSARQRSAVTGSSRFDRRPSMTSTVTMSPGLTPRRSASLCVNVIPSGEHFDRTQSGVVGPSQFASGRQAHDRRQIATMAGAQAYRNDALPFDNQHARLPGKVVDDAAVEGMRECDHNVAAFNQVELNFESSGRWHRARTAQARPSARRKLFQ